MSVSFRMCMCAQLLDARAFFFADALLLLDARALFLADGPL